MDRCALAGGYCDLGRTCGKRCQRFGGVLELWSTQLHAQEALMMQVGVTVDGVAYRDEVEPRMLLVHYLRERLGKVGTVVGCDTSNCGACTVLLDGRSVKSCSMLAVQADGHEVTTIE